MLHCATVGQIIVRIQKFVLAFLNAEWRNTSNDDIERDMSREKKHVENSLPEYNRPLSTHSVGTPNRSFVR